MSDIPEIHLSPEGRVKFMTKGFFRPWRVVAVDVSGYDKCLDAYRTVEEARESAKRHIEQHQQAVRIVHINLPPIEF